MSRSLPQARNPSLALAKDRPVLGGQYERIPLINDSVHRSWRKQTAEWVKRWRLNREARRFVTRVAQKLPRPHPNPHPQAGEEMNTCCLLRALGMVRQRGREDGFYLKLGLRKVRFSNTSLPHLKRSGYDLYLYLYLRR